MIIKRAYEELDQFNWSEEELMAYEQGKKRLKDELAALAERFDEGVKVGEARGEKYGIQIGEERGREQGEMKAKIAVAKNSLKTGMSIAVIAEITGLSPDTIKQLKEEKMF